MKSTFTLSTLKIWNRHLTCLSIIFVLIGFFGQAAYSQITGITGITPASRCGAGQLVLHATTTEGSTITWYDVPFYGLVLGTGEIFTTPDLEVTKTYYVDAEISGCSVNLAGGVNTGRVPVIATISANSIQAAIFYASTTFCNSVATEQTPTRTGTAGGVYTASGLTIDASTGAFTPSANSNGTYTITYTVTAAEGCVENPATTNVTITTAPLTSSISYTGSPFCTSLSAVTVNLTNPNSGTFSASPSGLSINSTSGTINPSLSLPGDYTVTYFVSGAGGCTPQTKTASITITGLPTAALAYSGTPFCQDITSASPTLTGTGAYTGGTYRYTNSGLTQSGLTFTSGVINPSTSTAGTYTIYYTAPASGNCAAVEVGTSITINPLPTAGISGTLEVCQNTTDPNITFTGDYGTAPYTFTYKINSGIDRFVSSAAGTNPVTATVTNSTVSPGTFVYTLTSVTDANGCTHSASGDATITVTPAQVATFSYLGSPFCKIGTVSPTYTGGGVAGAFTKTSGTGALSLIAETGAINLATSDAGSYTITNTLSACGSAVATYDIVINALPTATISGTLTACVSTVLTASTDAASKTYMWYKNNEVISGAADATYTVTESGDYKVKVTNTATNCEFTSLVSTVTIYPLPVVSITGNTMACTSTILTAVTDATNKTYEWYKDGVAIDLATASTLVVTEAGSYTVKVTNTVTHCEFTSAAAVVTIYTVPAATISTALAEVCVGAAPVITFEGSLGVAPYTFTYTINSGSDLLVTTSSGSSVTVAVPTSEAGNFIYTLKSVRDASFAGCQHTYSETATVKVNPLPTITLGANPNVTIGTTTADLTYSATTGTPATYSIVFNAAAITAGFASVTDAVLSGTPIVIAVPAVLTGGQGGIFNATLTVKNATTGCVSSYNIIVTIIPLAPTGSANQTFYIGDPHTVANLTATGAGIKWYAAETGGTPKLTTETLVTGTHYWASQTVSGSESTGRLDVLVTLNPVKNMTTSVSYPTIQGAITAASPNNTINVVAGTYNEPIITVNKKLTINGSNVGISAGAVVGARGAESIVNGGFSLVTTGSSVAGTVIDGFTVQGGFVAGSFHDGFRVGDANGGVLNVTIQNNIIQNVISGTGSDGIQVVGGSNNLQILNNEIVNNWRGMYLNISSGITISGNNIHGNNGGGNVGIGSDHQSNLTVINNIIAGHTAEGWGMDNVGVNVVAHHNQFTNNLVSIAWYAGTSNKIDAINNWWGDATGPRNLASNPCGNGSAVSDNVTFIPWWTTSTGVDGSGTITAAPVITTITTETNTVVTGTSESNAAITVYKNGTTSIGTTTADGNGNWAATVTTLATNDVITAKATASPKCVSAASASKTIPAAPTGSANQTLYIGDAIIANLTATGTGIKWYNDPTAGTQYQSTDALVTATHYYASQTISGIESTARLDVLVTLNPVKNMTTLVSYPTIQGAITAAASTNVIEVAAGTYTGIVNITKNLTLKGAQFGIDARGRSATETLIQGVFSIASGVTDVTIDGFKFKANSGANELGYGSPYHAAIDGGSATTKMTIQNNIMDGANGTAGPSTNPGLVFVTSNDVTFTHNQVNQTHLCNLGTQAAAFIIQSGTGAVINENNFKSGLGFITGANSVVSVTGNVISNVDREGIFIYATTNTSAFTFTGNTISDYNYCADGAITAPFIAYQRPASINGKTITFEMLTQLQTDNPGISSFLLKWIGPVHNVTRDLFYTQIQPAIDATTTVSGDVITVAAGTYNEAVVVNKPVSLLGAQANVPPIPITGVRPGGESIITGGGGNNNISVAADNVVVNGFEIADEYFSITTNNSGAGGSGGLHQNVTISYNYVHSTVANNAGITLGLNSPDNSTFTNYTVSHNLVNVSGSSALTAISLSGGANVIYNNTNISYNDITNPNANGIFSGAAPATSQFNNIVITHNNIHDMAQMGINMMNLSNGEISYNTFTHTGGYGAYVVMLGGTVNNNTFQQSYPRPAAWGAGPSWGLLLDDTGDGAPTSSHDVAITSNTFEYNDYAAAAGSAASGLRFLTGVNIGSMTLTSNTFNDHGASSGPVAIRSQATGTLTPAGNNIFDGVTLGTATTAQLFTIADKVVDAVDVSGYSLIRLKAGNVYVTPNSFYAVAGTTTPSIQRGIDAATSGDIVNVAAGTYNENVSVTKSLTFRGAQSGVHANTGTRTNPALESIINGTSPVAIMANNVIIDGFTIQGSENNGGYITGIWDNPAFSSSNGGFQILNNIIQNNVSGIDVGNDGTIQAFIKFNLIKNNNNPGPGSGDGITTDFGLQNTIIDQNKFDNNQALLNGFGTSGVQTITFSNNEITSVTSSGLYLLSTSGITVTGNNIHDNAAGISVDGGNDNITILNNVLVNNTGLGIKVSNPYASYGVGLNSNVSVHSNNISNNALGGLTVEPGTYTGTLDAINNYWGDATGPLNAATNPCGLGNAVSDNVTFSPWWTTSAMNEPGTAQARTDAPVITGPICNASTSVSGTSTEADGTVIKVFIGGVSQGTTIVASGAWTKSIAALTAGDVITASATATGKCVSVLSGSVTISDCSSLSIGATFGGGKVAYILQSGDPGWVSGETHGLIAATADQGNAYDWSNWLFTTISVSTGTAIGTGSANTANIIAQNGVPADQSGNPDPTMPYAAYIAKACNDGGYSDWYLPSKDELAKLRINRDAIGGFQVPDGNGYYFSSSQTTNSSYAWVYKFVDGGDIYDLDKATYNIQVRAIRSF